MSEKVPRVTAGEVIKVLERVGFCSPVRAEAIESTKPGR